MKNYRLCIITENQKPPHKADRVANLIKSDLNIQADPEIMRYEKFADSYKIEFFGKFNSDSDFIAEAIELTDRLASPWIVQYQRTTGNIGLIFNKSADCGFGRNEFNVVRWANLEIE